MTILQELESQISAWPNVTAHPHRFGGREFRVGNAEVGHVHTGGVVDIPFPRALHEVLLARGLAEPHHFLPNSGWVTFRIHGSENLSHALWLMRLSYLRYRLKSVSNPVIFWRRKAVNCA
jgi:luciferase-like monooxygenase